MEPPRLLAGVTLLYWGAMTGELVVALIMAVILEGKNWVKWNWDFDDSAYLKAFHVSLGLVGFVLFLVWMGEVDQDSLYNVNKWFPVCLLPVELAQRYGRSRSMKLNTFFYFARRRMKQDMKEGRPVEYEVLNTGYPYILLTIVVASCSERMDVFIHIAMLVLVAVIFMTAGVRRGLSWKRLIWVAPIMMGSIAYLQLELANIYKSYMGRGDGGLGKVGRGSSAFYSDLGQLGDVKQSADIQWRMWGDKVPEYLRMSNFNKCYGVGWSYEFKAEKEGFETMNAAFDSGAGIDVGANGEGVYVFRNEHQELLDSSDNEKAIVRLRGMGDSLRSRGTVSEQSVVPSIGGLFAVSDMAGSDVIPAVHPLGVLQLSNRKAVIDYRLWGADVNLLDRAPDAMDLQVSTINADDVMKLSREIGLSSYSSADEKVEAIRQFFFSNFTYSLYMDMPEVDVRGNDLQRFMHGVRKGHCEYFATTAALLLREQGVPARYCVGYVARERDGDTWIMRGTHAHAWCSVWIDGVWETVDLTPPDWLSAENDHQGADWSQGMRDWFHNIKQDFLMWRTDEENKSFVGMIFWGLGAILLGWVAYRLFKAKELDVVSDGKLPDYYGYEISAELVMLEGGLTEVIGARPVSRTYQQWVHSGEGKLDKQLFAKLKELVSLHEESRFGGYDRTQQIGELVDKVKLKLKM